MESSSEHVGVGEASVITSKVSIQRQLVFVQSTIYPLSSPIFPLRVQLFPLALPICRAPPARGNPQQKDHIPRRQHGWWLPSRDLWTWPCLGDRLFFVLFLCSYYFLKTPPFCMLPCLLCLIMLGTPCFANLHSICLYADNHLFNHLLILSEAAVSAWSALDSPGNEKCFSYSQPSLSLTLD